MTISSVAVTSLRKTKRTATKGLAPHLDAFLKAGKVQRSSGSPRAGWQLFNAKIRSAKAEGPHGARKPFGGRLWSRDDRRDVEKVAERGVELPTGALHRGDAAAAASSSSGRRHQGGVLRLRPPADGRLLDHRSHPAGRHRHVARRPLSRLRHHDVIAGGDGVLQGLPLPVGGRQLPGRLHPEVGSPPEGGPPSGRRRGGPAGPPDAGLHVGLRLPLHVGAQHLRRRHGDARRRGRPPPGPASRRGGRGGRGATPAGPATGRDDHKLPEERSPSSSPSSSSAAAAAAAASNSTQAACATAPPTDLTLGKAMCIGVAYASNIGGIATLPGTSPNLIFFEYLRQMQRRQFWQVAGAVSAHQRADVAAHVGVALLALHPLRRPLAAAMRRGALGAGKSRQESHPRPVRGAWTHEISGLLSGLGLLLPRSLRLRDRRHRGPRPGNPLLPGPGPRTLSEIRSKPGCEKCEREEDDADRASRPREHDHLGGVPGFHAMESGPPGGRRLCPGRRYKGVGFVAVGVGASDPSGPPSPAGRRGRGLRRGHHGNRGGQQRRHHQHIPAHPLASGRSHPGQPAVGADPGHVVHVLLLPAAGFQPPQRCGLRLRTLQRRGHGEGGAGRQRDRPPRRPIGGRHVGRAFVLSGHVPRLGPAVQRHRAVTDGTCKYFFFFLDTYLWQCSCNKLWAK
ncbi:solute carrier family 13 member 1 isoform X2 [Syngnathoides biaculeatus]|uniref:solute carrier family 13 member 1 isoform X2 n=1 Tax=Syngnathoides biaculeatus TaxID=300417 RepID=UPI002ADD7EE2|nr:solute carrier family 13 member 1 isoform X2 [Syngnathoides biaculeatus]